MNLGRKTNKHENEHKRVLARIDRLFSCPIFGYVKSTDAIIAPKPKRRLATARLNNLELRERGYICVRVLEPFDINQRNGSGGEQAAHQGLSPT